MFILKWFSDNFEKIELLSVFFTICLIIILFYFIYKIIEYSFYKDRKYILKYQTEIPKNHRAITIGYIVDKKLHKTDIAGSIIQLYIEKYLNIAYTEEKISNFNWLNNFIKKNLPFLIKKSWIITKSTKNTKKLLPSEKLVLKYLFPNFKKKNTNNNLSFSKSESQTIRLYDIKGRENNNKIFREIEDAVLNEMENFNYKKKYHNFIIIKKIIKATTLILSISSITYIFFKFSTFKNFYHIYLYLFLISVSFIIIYIFFKKIEKISMITVDGNKITNKTLGYKLYLEKVFKDRTNFFDLLETERNKLSRDIPYLISFNINNNFYKLVNSLEYDTEDKKESKSFFIHILLWPLYIIFSSLILYLFLYNNNVL